jgi:lysophospholipase L1-like esterase
MKTLLCYGDSNTWGADPATRGRFGPEVRWTGVLQRELADGYRVIEEGLNGRTTVWDDPIEPHRNGRAYLMPCLETHQPLDLVIVMLGTNDLKRRFDLSASDIAQGAASLAQLARNQGKNAANEPPAVLLMAPPPTTSLTGFDLMFEGAAAKSRLFGEYYRRAADWYGVNFFDAGSVIVSSELDGIHFDAGEHRKLGVAVAAEVRRLIG